MKNILCVGTMFLVGFVSGGVHADQKMGIVVSSDPVYNSFTRYERVATTETVCRDYMYTSNDGWIEQGTSSVFGSTQGLLGTAIGVAIGEHIGGGRGNDAAKIVGGIVGNRVGNNMARSRSAQRVCEPVTTYTDVPYVDNIVDHYRVVVKINNSEYVVNRSYSPEIGRAIPVDLTVR